MKRRSVEKIEKQKKIYELLNKTNKYLLKKIINQSCIMKFIN